MLRPVRDDAGVVAIVMTLAISTFLLGVAALAVDLGRAYLLKNDLQSIADRLALAGAKGLPVVGEAEGAINQLTTTLTGICQDEALDGLCPGAGVSAGEWTDRNRANGELTFFTDSDSDGRVTLADAVSNLSTPSQAIQVLLPPSTVQFGLAGILGFTSAEIQASATARIGTPLGSGILPFALTPDDVAAGRFCVTDTDVAGPAPASVSNTLQTAGYSATASGPFRLTLDTAFPNGFPVTGAGASFTLSTSEWWRVPRGGTQFHLKSANGTEARLSSVRTSWRTYRVTVPAGPPGSTVQVWATGSVGRSPSTGFTTNPVDLTYTGTPPVTETGACEQSSAARGFVQLARGDSGDPLEQNIRSGPVVNLLPSGTGALSTLIDCVATVLRASTGCLTLGPSGGFSTALTNGLLKPAGNRPGRLIGDTGNGTDSVNGYAIDGTSLFDSPHLTDPQYAGSLGLRSALEAGRPADPSDRGWITAAAVRSHRLAVLPVVDPEPLTGENGYRITSFRYVWIDSDDEGRGLLWENAGLVGFEGYVIDSGYFPAVMSGSATVGPFLGSDMPKEAVLMTDLGSSGE